MNPRVISGSVAGLFAYAGEAMLVSPTERQAKLIADAGIILASYAYFYWVDMRSMRRKLSELQHAVIDKTGRTVADPQASAKVIEYFKGQIFSNIFLVPPIAAAVWVLAPARPLAFIAYQTADLAYSYYARRKLERKEWTVQTNPPELKKEVKQVVGEAAMQPMQSFAKGRPASQLAL